MAVAVVAAGAAGNSTGQIAPDLAPSTIKRMSIEELVDLEITSVSGRAMPLSLAPSAIDVITDDDIRRSGATNIMDALRLATGVHVAQVDGNTWAISARGFNITTANKLQVLMDGRPLYTSLFSGVFWDVQHTFLPDIDQIEVIRGPGATLWGANAVNGVINIRTKSADETQGWKFRQGIGFQEQSFGGLRYGGRIGDSETYYRVYVAQRVHDELWLEQPKVNAMEDYGLLQGGFRIDSNITADDLITVQGDLYKGRFGQRTGADEEASGGNVLARWTRQTGPGANFQLQAFYDHAHRAVPSVADWEHHIFDLSWQHRFPIGTAHSVIWGLTARSSVDHITSPGPGLAFLPESETLNLFSAFIQDEIELLPERLMATIGTKLEHNSFSGFEFQPSVRFSFAATPRQTFWGAVSRAVRTPTRIDQDLFAPNPAFAPPTILQGNRGFDAEELIAYELGYRVKPVGNVTTDLALFYHDYDNLRSLERVGAGAFPVRADNKLQGESYGAELAVRWQPVRWWQTQVGYTLMQTQFRADSGSTDVSGGATEGNDPNHILVLRSSCDLSNDVTLDAVFRHVDRLPRPQTPAYSTLDLRLAWRPSPEIELAIVGRNLLDESHPEFRGTTLSREIGRSVFFTVTWDF